MALGAGAHVVEAIGTASRLIRGREHLRIPAPERAGVAMQLGSAGYLDAGGIYAVTSPGHLHVADETQTFDLQWRGDGGSKAFVVDYDRLGVSVDVVREAAPRIKASPVYNLFRSHLASLFASEATLPPGPAVTAVGNADHLPDDAPEVRLIQRRLDARATAVKVGGRFLDGMRRDVATL